MKYKLLTEAEVIEWFKVGKSKLRNMRTRMCPDPLPFTKIGGEVRYREDLVIKWLDRNTYGSTDEYFEAKRTG